VTYAILYNPGHNRVYFETSLALSESEFKIVSGGLSARCEHARPERIGGVNYLTFQTDAELSRTDIDILYGLSFAYAVFGVVKIDGRDGENGDDGGPRVYSESGLDGGPPVYNDSGFDGEPPVYLAPVGKTAEPFVDESIGVILKYTGKTNELFTRMMLNIARGSGSPGRNARLLDPVAGKGTTLYEGLIKGFDVYGVEIDGDVVNEACNFVKRFLENAKYKYEFSSIRVSGENRSFTALRSTFVTAKTKEDHKKKNHRTIEFVAGSSVHADKYYIKNFFDMIAGDLPYGVQHGNVTKRKQSSLTRNPAELLGACLPAWAAVLRPGGTMVLAWNANVLPRGAMEALFQNVGLTVKNDAVYLGFGHRVDQSIYRDIIVAVK